MGYPPQDPPGYGDGPPAAPPPPPGYGGEYGQPAQPAQPQSSTPQVLSIIGIVCWFCCSPAAIVLGLVAQGQFRAQGRPDTIARVAWIGGVVALILGVISAVIRLQAGT